MNPFNYVCERAKEMGFSPWTILGTSRLSEYVVARRQIARELREKGYSLPAIGRAMNRHHTTVMNLLGLFDPIQYPPRAA